MSQESPLKLATLAGGCFWCIEAVFNEVDGVQKAVSGYAGGAVPDPNYRQVCTGQTGHAEAVQISYDPAIISFREILEIFFSVHDPTTLNRQGADKGTQYRSAIFCHNDEQRRIAEELIKELDKAGIWDKPIGTEVVPLETFYPAEDYHQEYFSRNPEQGYCRMVISPKVSKFRKQWAERLKT